MDCRDLLSTLDSIRVVFVRRTTNLAARALVKAVGSNPGLHVWGFYAPPCISAILASELI